MPGAAAAELKYAATAGVAAARGPAAEIADYYASESSRSFLLVGLYVMPFIVGLRMWEEGSVHRRSVLQSNLHLVSGIVYIALFSVAAAASSVVASR